MTVAVSHRPRARRLRLPGELSQPLFRNGHALALSSILAAVIGFFFWLLAARRYSPAIVGQDAVAISTLQTIGSIAQLNLANGMIRFLPGAGGQRRRFVMISFALSALVALVLSVGFLALVPVAFPSLSFLTASPFAIATWIVTTVAWSIFVVQDGALTGLRRAPWVPVENAVFAVAKAALVIPLAAIAPENGIFAAWGFSTVLVVVPTVALVFWWAVPREQARDPEGGVTAGQLARYIPYDYLASLCWFGAVGLLPLFIIHQIGPAGSAFFSLAWVIAYVFFLVSINLGSSLIVESIADPADLAERCRSLVAHLLKFLLPAAVVVIAAAPLILQLFGSRYAAAGVTTMRLLVASSLPFIITSTAVSALRVLRRTGLVLIADGTFCAIVTVCTWVLLPHFGILATGIAWVAGQSVCAVGTYACAMRLGLAPRPLRPRAAAAAVALALVRAGSGPGRAGRVGELVVAPALRGLRRVARQTRALVTADLDEFLPGHPERATPVEVVSDEHDRVVLRMLGDAAGKELLVVARGEGAHADLTREARVLDALARDERLGDLRDLLPGYRVVERPVAHLAGIEADRPGRRAGALCDAEVCGGLEFARALHERTGHLERLSSGRIDDLFGPALARLAGAHPSGRVPPAQSRALAEIRARLEAGLSGRSARLSWVHGDYAPTNVAFVPATGKVAHVLGWGRARADGLSVLDVLSWTCSVEAAARRVELGSLIALLITTGELPNDGALALGRGDVEAAGIEPGALVLALWAMHVGGNLARSPAYLRNPLWWVNNVERVLRALP